MRPGRKGRRPDIARAVRTFTQGMPEDQVSSQCRAWLRGVAQRLRLPDGRVVEAVYSLETGALGQWIHDPERSKRPSGMRFIGRRQGTGTTPGFPDCAAIIVDPLPYTLTVEFKGPSTTITEEQWFYAEMAALAGRPHLIVRTPGALLTGLRYLGLLPVKWERTCPLPGYTWGDWPENLNFLDGMRARFWEWTYPEFRRGWGGLLLPTNRKRRPNAA
jgi:hypothetical protein